MDKGRYIIFYVLFQINNSKLNFLGRHLFLIFLSVLYKFVRYYFTVQSR